MTDDVPSDEPSLACPQCSAAVAVEPGETFGNCPACGEAFALPAVDQEAARRDDELDGLRVRHVATVRRALIRTQTYFTVLTIGFAAGAGECLFEAKGVGQWGGWRIASLGLAVLLLWAAGAFLRKARHVARELSKPLLPEPETPPDFSGLGDGSQIARHLEEL